MIAVPPFEAKYLRRGHAVHFRCEDPEAQGMRIDVMTRMRGVAPFPTLWQRRTSIELADGDSLRGDGASRSGPGEEDAARQGLADGASPRSKPTSSRTAIARLRPRYASGCRELRTPELLIETAQRWPRALVAQLRHRPLLRHARPGRAALLASSLSAEEATERRADARYWAPLRAELERLRLGRPRRPN